MVMTARISRYWLLVTLTSSGNARNSECPAAKSFIQEQFGSTLTDTAVSDREVQELLLEKWRSGNKDALVARLCLRCYVSHQIRFVCVQLAQQFGETYGFSASDLFPIVLDDDGKLDPNYQPYSITILENYNLAKSQLNTWTTRLTKTHHELDQFFLNHGLYRVSDWAILNDTSIEHLQRILTQYHQLSSAEVKAASQLLTQYHGVYRNNRLQQRQQGRHTRKCQPPTSEQLYKIDAQLTDKAVLSQLRRLASQLRQYRIHARGGTPTPHKSEALDWDRLVDGYSISLQEIGEENFLAAYQQAIPQCLDLVLEEVIEARMTQLRKRKPSKEYEYLEGLYLFVCEGMSMGNLADQIGLSSRVQAQRLLSPKRLRDDVRRLLLPRLKKCVQAEAVKYVSSEHLKQVDDSIEQYLIETIDQIMRAASKEVRVPVGRTANSLFSQRLCRVVSTLREKLVKPVSVSSECFVG